MCFMQITQYPRLIIIGMDYLRKKALFSFRRHHNFNSLKRSLACKFWTLISSILTHNNEFWGVYHHHHHWSFPRLVEHRAQTKDPHSQPRSQGLSGNRLAPLGPAFGYCTMFKLDISSASPPKFHPLFFYHPTPRILSSGVSIQNQIANHGIVHQLAPAISSPA